MKQPWAKDKSEEAQFSAYSRYVGEMEVELEAIEEWNRSIKRYFEIQKAPHVVSIEQTYQRMKSGEEATKQTLTLLDRLRDVYTYLYKSSDNTTLYDGKFKKNKDHIVEVPQEAKNDPSIMSLATLTSFWYHQSAEYRRMMDLIDVAITDAKLLVKQYSSDVYKKIEHAEKLEATSIKLIKQADDNIKEYHKVVKYYAKYRNNFDSFVSRQSDKGRRDVWKQRVNYLMVIYQLWCIHHEYCNRSLEYSQDLMRMEDERVDKLYGIIITLAENLCGKFGAITSNLRSCVEQLRRIPPASSSLALKHRAASSTNAPAQTVSPQAATTTTTTTTTAASTAPAYSSVASSPVYENPNTTASVSPSNINTGDSPRKVGAPSTLPPSYDSAAEPEKALTPSSPTMGDIKPPPPRQTKEPTPTAAAIKAMGKKSETADSPSSPSAKTSSDASSGGGGMLNLADAINKKAQFMKQQSNDADNFGTVPPTAAAESKSTPVEPIKKSPPEQSKPTTASPTEASAPLYPATSAVPRVDSNDFVYVPSNVPAQTPPPATATTQLDRQASGAAIEDRWSAKGEDVQPSIRIKGEQVNKKIAQHTQIQQELTASDHMLLESLPAFPLDTVTNITSLGIEKLTFRSHKVWLVYTKSFHIYCTPLFDPKQKKKLQITSTQHHGVVDALFLQPQPQLTESSAANDMNIQDNSALNGVVDATKRAWKLNGLNTIATAHGAVLTLTEYNEGMFARNKEHVITLPTARLAQEWVAIVNFHNRFPGQGDVPPLTRSEKKKLKKQEEEAKKQEELAQAQAKTEKSAK